MIDSIVLKGVTSYSPDNPAILGPLGRVNLIYGLNGSGKSTISNYLQNMHHPDYNHCQVVPVIPQDQVLVYNQAFVERNFHQQTQPGIFTLNEGNIEAETAIKEAEKELVETERQKSANLADKQSLEEQQLEADEALKEDLWKIKKLYDESNLSYCLEGCNTNKGKFKDKLLATPLSSSPIRSVMDLTAAVAELHSAGGDRLPDIPLITLAVVDIEEHPVFSETISASGDSYLSTLIEQLGNSDWVKSALPLLEKSHGQCPLCQQALPHDFSSQVKALFDKAYEKKIEQIETLNTHYGNAITSLKSGLSEVIYEQTGLNKNSDFTQAKAALEKLLNENLRKIQQKLSSPAQPVTLTPATELVNQVNEVISKQKKINFDFNKRLLEKDQLLEGIKVELWQYMRQQGKSTIEGHTKKTNAIAEKHRVNSSLAIVLRDKIKTARASIVQHQSRITNIEDSIKKINASLASIGLTGFKIEKEDADTTSYRLVRPGGKVDVFRSLSEGEKTLITFLYFIELCAGSVKSDTPVVLGNRVVMIDDPISSLSHNYVYEMASLIYHRFLSKQSGFKQIFVLTHNLFFFHELLRNADRKEVEKYKCFRVVKRDYSSLSVLGKDEIKNDYQAFWQVLKEVKESNISSAVLPNIMRNILEHYFAFIHKKDDLRIALTKLEGEDTGEFKPLYRYINRESHGDGVNITDFGEIEPSSVLGKFKKVFIQTGYPEHYYVMMGEEIPTDEPELVA